MRGSYVRCDHCGRLTSRWVGPGEPAEACEECGFTGTCAECGERMDPGGDYAQHCSLTCAKYADDAAWADSWNDDPGPVE